LRPQTGFHFAANRKEKPSCPAGLKLVFTPFATPAGCFLSCSARKGSKFGPAARRALRADGDLVIGGPQPIGSRAERVGARSRRAARLDCRVCRHRRRQGPRLKAQDFVKLGGARWQDPATARGRPSSPISPAAASGRAAASWRWVRNCAPCLRPYKTNAKKKREGRQITGRDRVAGVAAAEKAFAPRAAVAWRANCARSRQ